MSRCPACLRALEMAGADPASIDLLIVATVTPDMAFPSSSALLADQLGMPDAAAYDLSAGCTGFVYAVVQAHAMLAAGLAKRALVVGGDVLSKILDWTRPLDGRALRRRRRRRRDGGGRGRRLPRVRARRGRRRRLQPVAPGQRLTPVRRAGEVRQDERPRGVQVRDPGDGQLGGRRFWPSAGWRSRTSTSTFRTRPMSGSSITLCESSGSRREDRGERRAVREHLVGLDPARAGRCGRRRAAQTGQAGALDGYGRRPHVGLRVDQMDTRDDWSTAMSNDRLHVPGTGIVRGRDGQGRRRGRARGDGGLRRRLRVLGHGPEGAVLRLAGRGARRDRGAAARARRDVARARRGAALARHRAGVRRRPLGRRVRGAGLGAVDLRARRDRDRPPPRARDGRRREGASGLDGRDPRPGRRGGREPLPQDRRRVARELQLPRPARDLGRDAFGRRSVRRGGARRRAPCGSAPRLRRVPLAARRACRRGAAARRSRRCISPRDGRRSCRR